MRFGYTIVALLLTPICRAAEPGAIQFNRDVRPILSDKCYACHGPDPAQRKTKFRFDQEDGAKSVIIAGDAAASKLIQRITSDNPAIRMPPAYQGRDKLSPSEIQTLRQWVGDGYNVSTNRQELVPESLQTAKVLVVSDALGFTGWLGRFGVRMRGNAFTQK
jgi:hypothetical protein